MNDNKQMPNAWGKNKNIPDSWGKSNNLPENWGKQRSNAANGSPFGGTRTTSSANAEKIKNLSDKARSGAGRLAGAAKKVGGAAKNATGNVVDRAKSNYAAKKVVLTEENTGEAFVVPSEKAFDNDEIKDSIADISNVENAVVPETDAPEDECLSAIEDDGYSESADTEEYLDQQESVSLDSTESIVDSYLFKITNDELAKNIREAKTAIENGQWIMGAESCTSAIEVDDSSPIPFLFVLLCYNKLSSINELGELPLKKGLMSLEDYRKAFTNADDELRELLNEMNMQSIYSYSAMVVSKDSDRKERLLELISAYRNLYSFMRSNELSDELKQKASGYLYDISCSALSFAKRYSEYSQVSQMFKQIGHYEDSAELSKKCFDSFKQSVQETLASDDATISELEAVYQDLENAKDLSGLDKLRRECQDKLDTARLRGENDYYNQRYEESLKKSRKIKIIVGIAAGVVILLLGIKSAIAGLSLIKGDKEQNNDDSTVATTAAADTEAETTTAVTTVEMTTDNNQDSTTDVVTNLENEESETTFAAETTSIVKRTDTTEAVKRALIAHLDKELATEEAREHYFTNRDIKYAVYDINADGVDELFIRYDTMASNKIDVYIYQNGNYVLAESACDGGISICCEDHFIVLDEYGGYRLTRIFNINDGNLVQIDELQVSGSIYIHNGISITQSEYENLLSKYENNNLIDIWNNSNPVSDLVDMSPYQQQTNQSNNSNNNRSLYDGYKHIENAPSDMVFYDNTDYISLPKGIVQTESTGLNLRQGPGKSYDVILEIPKGAEVYVYGMNSEWCYVSYYVGGARADYGYVSKDYLSISVG